MSCPFIPPEIQAILTQLQPDDARLVGGAVRAFVQDQPCPADVDITTPALPETVMERLAAGGYKPLPTGLGHGTVTVVTGAYQVEITTLREDTGTDGRHATVAFTQSWEADSNRRDFTMNALLLAADGTLTDFHHGLADLKAAQVRFIGNPQHRVAEDYLRILRYYRFAAHIGLPEDLATVTAVLKDASTQLPTLSAERITAELFKLLWGPHAVDVLAHLRDAQVLNPLNLQPRRLEDLEIALHTWPRLDVLGRWYIVFGGQNENPHITLSNKQKRQLALIRTAEERVEELGLFPLAAATNKEAAIVARAMTAKRSAVMFLTHAEIPEFPLKGQDVLDLGIPAGEKVGLLLANVQEWWLQQNLPDRAACLAQLVRLAKF